MICNLNIRHTYLNIKINNQGKTLHVWSLTTDSNKDSHQYSGQFKLKLFFQIWYFYNLEIIVISNLNIRNTYLNTKINSQTKTLHAWSLTTESKKIATSILKICTSTSLPKIIFLQSGDHCDLKFKY